MSPETLRTATALPELAAADLPALTREQMREVDRLMIQEFGIQLLQMMENAGLVLAELVRLHLGVSVRGRRVVVLAGQGNNGGGGLAAARRLSCWGADVQVILSGAAEDVRDVPALQLGVLKNMGVPVRRFAGSLPPHEVIIDAVIGYGLEGAPRGTALDLIEATNASPSPAISLDTPSGLDVDSGQAPGEAVRAASTLTLALPKVGLLESKSHRYVGHLYLADISVPQPVYSRLGLSVAPPFAEGPMVRIITE